MKEAKSGEIQSLKSRIRRLEADNRELVQKNKKLLSEIRTLEAYREVTTDHIGDKLDDIPVEKVVKRVEKKKKAKKKAEQDVVKPACPKCFGPIVRVKYRSGHVHVCSNPKCKYRSTVK